LRSPRAPIQDSALTTEILRLRPDGKRSCQQRGATGTRRTSGRHTAPHRRRNSGPGDSVAVALLGACSGSLPRSPGWRGSLAPHVQAMRTLKSPGRSALDGAFPHPQALIVRATSGLGCDHREVRTVSHSRACTRTSAIVGCKFIHCLYSIKLPLSQAHIFNGATRRKDCRGSASFRRGDQAVPDSRFLGAAPCPLAPSHGPTISVP
jgi:hypothetical protein